MSLWSRSTPPTWIPSVPSPKGYVSTETGELLVAFVDPLVLPGSGATITNVAFDREAYAAGDTIKIAVDFSQPVTVVDEPVLGLIIGSANVRAKYIPSRSNSVARMNFYYVVKATDAATAGQVKIGGNAATAASVVKQNVTYTAKTAGTAGNSITIAYVDPSADNAVLSVAVASSAITVHLATGVAGAITSTNTTITAAIVASTAANALVGSSIASGHGTDVVTAFAAANLAGGTVGGTAAIAAKLVEGQITFTAATAGAAGNAITIAFVNPNSNSASLSVGVVSSAITVHLATNSSGTITSTGALIATAIAGSGAAAALVGTALVSSGTAVVTAFSATNLTGGFAAQTGSLDLQGGSITNANPTPVAATLTAGSGNSGVVFTQVEPGTVGNASTLLIQKGTVTPAKLQLDNILFTAVTPGTTGNAVTIDIVNNNATAATLSMGDVVYTAIKLGTAGNSITVSYIDPGVANANFGISVVGTAIKIHLATNTAGTITTTSAQIVDGIAGTYGSRSGASNLVTAAISGGGLTVTAESATSLATGSNGTLGNSVTSNAITVVVGTDANGNPNTTASAMVTYLLTISQVTALVTPSLVGNGTVFVRPTASAVSLFGGTEAVLSLTRTPYTQHFTLNLATTANSISSTAGQVVTFVNNLVPSLPAHPQNYISAANVGNGTGTMATKTLTSFISGSTSNLSANTAYSGVTVPHQSSITVN